MKRLSLLVVLAAGLSSCVARDYATNNRADVVMRIKTVNPAFLLSDVLTNGGVLNDDLTIELEALPKNPLLGTDLAPLANNVMLVSYTVDYFRSDGRNVEGIDVPYSISGGMAGQIDIGGTLSTPFVIVRHQAKLEPPLLNMDRTANSAAAGGSVVVNVTARITIYAKTTSGKDLSTVFNYEITFGDFPDSGA